MNLEAAELAELTADFESLTFVDSVTFKLKDGSTVAGPYDCRVGQQRIAATEQQAGGKLVLVELFPLYLNKGIDVQPFWRAVVTFSTGAVVNYTVKDAGSPITNEFTRKVVIERVR